MKVLSLIKLIIDRQLKNLIILLLAIHRLSDQLVVQENILNELCKMFSSKSILYYQHAK
jgi:hypothetical protein